ncbi:MAG: hypothetical protein QF437_02135 [Planctomycetota bacterium]|jgi:hypothetical protein|nr:hypothetical protein [Planctomycetota bacterium]MDP7129253.1 hypothetical protein [Planctomycetota bacterium]MDP7251183.1 hypothetical protein [Planctomycetota bacterium]
MTLQLTEDQRRAIESTPDDLPRLVIGNREYVLIPTETYEQVRAVLDAEEIDPSFYEFDEVSNS